MKNKTNAANEILSMVIRGTLFLAMLLMVVFAASAYRSAAAAQKKNNAARTAVSFIATSIKAGGTNDIRLEAIDGIPTLIITDPVSGLEQRIFHRGEEIIENYGAVGYDFYKEGESVIGETKIFEMTLKDDRLLIIKTDYGDSCICLKK